MADVMDTEEIELKNTLEQTFEKHKRFQELSRLKAEITSLLNTLDWLPSRASRLGLQVPTCRARAQLREGLDAVEKERAGVIRKITELWVEKRIAKNG